MARGEGGPSDKSVLGGFFTKAQIQRVVTGAGGIARLPRDAQGKAGAKAYGHALFAPAPPRPRITIVTLTMQHDKTRVVIVVTVTNARREEDELSRGELTVGALTSHNARKTAADVAMLLKRKADGERIAQALIQLNETESVGGSITFTVINNQLTIS